MRNSRIRRSSVAVVAATCVFGLGACSVGLEDETDAAATQSQEATDPAPTGEPDDESSTPPEETVGSPADEPDSQPDSEPENETDDADDAFDPDPAGIAEGLTIKARPQGGQVTAEGAYDCGGQPVTVASTLEAVVLTGDCPELSVQGAESSVLVASDVPTELAVNAHSVNVLLNIAADVNVRGESNQLGFARADSVTVAGSGNELAFDNTGSVTIEAAGQENKVVFLEAGSITVAGAANGVGYRSGPPPVDNGVGNEFISGQQAGEYVADVLAELESTFVELTESLPA